tara:strand:- start:27793 stop:28980 length:1188 start_codon:yes stop_codon:yes gene_type:complete
LKDRALGKVRSALGGILLGAILVLAGLALLWMNESRAVADYRSIRELESYTIPVSPHRVNPENEGSAVYLTWRASTSDTLRDREFGIERVALRMVRTVEMFQWKENRPSKREIEAGVEPTYELDWSSERIASEEFLQPDKHENPPMRYITKTWLAEDISLGAFQLPASLLLKLDDYVPVDATNAVPTILESVIHDQGNLYLGENIAEPMVGDLRISYRALDPQQISLIARQFGTTFDTFVSRDGRVHAPIRTGVHTQQQLLSYERSNVKVITILLRMLGFFLTFAGLMMIFSPMTILAGSVPVFQRVMRFGLAMVCLLFSGVLSLFVISISWFAHRPWITAGLGLLILILAILMSKAFKKPDEMAVRLRKAKLEARLASRSRSTDLPTSPNSPAS